MLRNLVAALALASIAQTALGLGIGSLQKFSALNEPLSAQIEILGAGAADFDTLTVKLASKDQFERAGILREAILLGLKFKAVQARNGNDYIQITTQQPVKEPYLNFLLEMNWANGRMVREYTVLLDPPLYDPLRKPSSTTTSPAPFIPEPSPAVNEPLPASRPSPSSSSPSIAEYSPTTYSGGDTIGPVQAHDTLWKLADTHRPADVSVQQMMMALFLANPEAFGSNNINVLKRGAILRMPEQSELAALSHSEALSQAQQHHQAWSNYRQGAVENVSERPLGGNAASNSVGDIISDAEQTSTSATDDDGRLELVAPEQASSGVGGNSGSDSSLMQEQLDAKEQENAELLAKITEADEIIDLMQRQLEIKDEELAALQARLRELGVEAADTQAAQIVDNALVDDGPQTIDETMVDEITEIVDGGIEEPTLDGSQDESPAEVLVDDSSAQDDAAVIEDSTADSATTDSTDDSMGDSEQPAVADGFLARFIPAHILEMVPGGQTTILGVLGAILLLLFGGIIKWMTGSREKEMPAPKHAQPKVMETVAEDLSDDLDDTVAEDTVNELETDTIEADVSNVSDSFEDTLEATADDLTPLAPEEPQAEPEEDPLQEVNVYLAYERFDQAEELVRNVIADNPDEPKYRLQLLEVFYSANDQASYEGEARNLLDAVGEDDPMWETALAMWSEISPDRALFAEGGVALDAADTGSMKAFVDITSDADNADITGGDDESLDFEIGSLGDGDDSDDDLTLEFEGTSDLESDEDDSSLDDELQTVQLGAADSLSGDDTVDFELSLQSTELDELTETTDDAPEEDAAIDFDLALEDTSDMDSIVIDETLELPKASIEEESLEDLTKSMEDSMAELELDMGSSDDDLESALEADMDLDVGEFDIDGEDTIGIEAGADVSDGDLEDVEKTVVLDEGMGSHSEEGDEVDTKLNLAKAYIELGDNDGAKSILDEVARDGTDEQKSDAQHLIDQIS
jgi:pilus assembly protein FimV